MPRTIVAILLPTPTLPQPQTNDKKFSRERRDGSFEQRDGSFVHEWMEGRFFCSCERRDGSFVHSRHKLWTEGRFFCSFKERTERRDGSFERRDGSFVHSRHKLCHCEERSDVAILLNVNTKTPYIYLDIVLNIL